MANEKPTKTDSANKATGRAIRNMVKLSDEGDVASP